MLAAEKAVETLTSHLIVLLVLALRLPSCRQATVADAEALRALALSVDGDNAVSAPKALSWWQAQLSLASNRWWMLEERHTGLALGLLSLASRSAAHGLPDRQHISLFMISRNFRGHGHGTRLLHTALHWLDGQRAECTSLFVRPSNQAALRLYSRFGFRPHATIRGYYTQAPVEDGLLFVRWRKESALPFSPSYSPAASFASPPSSSPLLVSSTRLRGGASLSSPSGLRQWALSRVTQARQAAARPLRECNDSPADRAVIESWRQSSCHETARLLFSEASEMDPAMRVQVREHMDGWRTLNLVGLRRSILHGVVKTDASSGQVEPSAVIAEYLKAQAALALAGLVPAARPPQSQRSERVPEAARFLFLGLGAGILPRLVRAHAPHAQLTAIECDGTVVAAATDHLGLRECGCEIVVADAVAWVAERAEAQREMSARLSHQQQQQEEEEQNNLANALQFDAVLIDVFDEANLCPPTFYSEAFLSNLRDLLREDGVIVHNLHMGSKTLNRTLAEAENAYGKEFVGRRGSGVVQRSLDSKSWAGNSLIAVSPGNAYSLPSLQGQARAARERFQLHFDAAARCRTATRLAVWRSCAKGTK